MVEIVSHPPSKEHDQPPARRIPRRKALAIIGGATALTLGGAISARLLINQSDQKPDQLSDELPPIPGPNLLSNHDFQQETIESGKKKPMDWISSNPDESKFWPNIGPNNSNLVEVNARTKSSWETEKPFTLERGKYVISYKAQISENSPNTRPQVRLTPVGTRGERLAPVNKSSYAISDLESNGWPNYEEEIDISGGQFVLQLSGYELDSPSAEFSKPGMVRYAVIGLHRIYKQGDPGFPGNNNSNRRNST